MTAKEFVKEKYPNAKTEKHTRGMIKGMQEKYYLIRDGKNTMYMASGKTKSNAWVNAKKVVQELTEDWTKIDGKEFNQPLYKPIRL